METPSIKGAFMVMTHARINDLVSKGQVTRESLQERLDAEDLDTLDSKVSVSKWYPVTTAARFMNILQDEEGSSGEEFLVGVGRELGESFRSDGVYQQFEFAERSSREMVDDLAGKIKAGATLDEIHKREQRHFDWISRMISPMFKLFWNFGEIETQPLWQNERLAGWILEMKGVGPLPDELRHGTSGFLQVLAEVMSYKDAEVTSSRPSPDRILFRVVDRSGPRA